MKLYELQAPTNIVDLIGSRCQPYLMKTTRPLYRAMRGNTKMAMSEIAYGDEGDKLHYSILTARLGRSSRDTPNVFHEVIGQWMDDRFGWNSRADGTFAAGAEEAVSNYGINVCYFVPIGEFRFVWSPDVEDMYDLIDTNYFKGSRSKIELLTKEVFDLLDEANYTDKNLNEAIESHKEISFQCGQYLMVERKIHFESGGTGHLRHDDFEDILHQATT